MSPAERGIGSTTLKLTWRFVVRWRRVLITSQSTEGSGWLAAVDVQRLGEFVIDAWRMRARETLVGDLDEADNLSSADLGRRG
jgi:hypothetical protein